jgi:hypothetical protein
MAAGSLLLWLPLLLFAGFKPLFFELVVHPLVLYSPGRSIPIGQGPDAPAVILAVVADIVIWSATVFRLIRRRPAAAEAAGMLALLITSLLLFTWVRTRADGEHVLDALPMAVALVAALLSSRPAPSRSRPRLDTSMSLLSGAALVLAAGALLVRDVNPAGTYLPHATLPLARAWMPESQLSELIHAIDSQVPPGGTIYVGTWRNDLARFSDTSIYFLSDRQPGTVYWDAFPGLTNTARGESTIICQLERSGTSLVVLGPNPDNEAWNLSSQPGSPLLDDWLSANTVSHTDIGPYILLQLKGGARPGSCPAPAQGAA